MNSIISKKKKKYSGKKCFPKNVTHNFTRFLAPCQNLEKTNGQIPRKRLERRKEVRTDTILLDPSDYRWGSKKTVETITFSTPRLCDLVPAEIKESPLSTFKEKEKDMTL